MNFTLYEVKDPNTGQVMIFTTLGEPMRKALGDNLKEHTFTLKDPVTDAQRQESERLMWSATTTGVPFKDESLRDPAMCVAYLKSWTLDSDLNLQAISARVHPALVAAAAAEIDKMVFPKWANSDFFTSIARTLPGDGSPEEPDSTT